MSPRKSIPADFLNFFSSSSSSFRRFHFRLSSSFRASRCFASLQNRASLSNQHLRQSFSHPSLPSPSPENPVAAFVALLKASSRTIKTLLEAELFHCRAIRTGFDVNDRVRTGLLNLYVKCGRLDVAHQLFDEMCNRDVLAWTILISGYARSSKFEIGLELFGRMLSEGTWPNCFTLASVLKCCAGFRDLGKGKSVHGWILRKEIEFDVVLQNSVLDLYAKCTEFGYTGKFFEMMSEKDSTSWNIMIGAYLQIGDINGSMELFRISPFPDVACWNTIINGQIEHGHYMTALQLLHNMVETEFKFNHFTLSMALVVAGRLALLYLGRHLHCRILRMGYENDLFITNSLIDMYCKCGKMEASLAIFNASSGFTDQSTAGSISWSAMVAGYVQNGMGEEALELLSRMFCERVKVDQFTLTSAAVACSYTGLLEQGMQVHGCVEKLGHGFDAVLASAIIDMYAKCGSLKDARKTFDITCTVNVVVWASIIGSYASYGEGTEAIQLFERMLEEKVMPNEISFVHVLSACSHAGLVEEGYNYFKSMQDDYGIVPSIEHFTCMVDLLGRAGFLEKAKAFILENNISDYTVVWITLLSACRVHNDIEMASIASKQLIQLEPSNAGHYVLLSNMYATKQIWMEASNLRSMMHERRVRKSPGRSWIQIKNKVHTFLVGDRSHPQATDIYSYLESLISRLKEMGYSSRIELVFHDVEEEQKESTLSYHSEKLAIAYGIISTPFGSTIRAMKNLRVCADCHEAIKYITLAACREIILRDAHRFHHFKHGKCSCGDYW